MQPLGTRLDRGLLPREALFPAAAAAAAGNGPSRAVVAMVALARELRAKLKKLRGVLLVGCFFGNSKNLYDFKIEYMVEEGMKQLRNLDRRPSFRIYRIGVNGENIFTMSRQRLRKLQI